VGAPSAETSANVTEHAKADAERETLTFQAETRQLLDIVTHSLYTDREVFLRELVSNAADALEKLRHVQTAGASVASDGEGTDLQIKISVDERNHTITIQDNGIGMTKEELVRNLGTIARSGSKAFLQELQEAGQSGDVATNLIGMFGVGFYSAFMVADSVSVYSKSAVDPDAPAYMWTSSGSGDYEIVEAEGVSRGTKIVLHLKEDAHSFADEAMLESTIMRYSNFVSFPIYLNRRKVNTLRALWTVDPNEVEEQEFTDFYRYISSAFDKPMFRVHLSSDAPIHLRALFFIGESHLEKQGMGRMPPGVNVYSRKVLIKSKADDILPDWMRFFRGVVDSEDLPLSISRENMQDSALIRKISNVLTRRLLKFLEDQSRKDKDKYLSFFREFGNFIKEGVISDHGNVLKPHLGKLLRFETSKSTPGELVSFDDYISRAAVEQKDIYYLCAPDRSLAEASPYYEAFQKRGLEVIFCYEPVDEFVMAGLMNFDGRRIVSAETADLELPELLKGGDSDAATKGAEGEGKEQAGGLQGEELDQLLQWAKTTLKGVSEVKVTKRLSSTPAIVTGHASESMRKMMKLAGVHQEGMDQVDLEINPDHEIMRALAGLRNADPTTAADVLEQVFDNARCAAGILDDPRTMLPRLNRILAGVSARGLPPAGGSSAQSTASEPTGASSEASQ